MKQLHLVTLKDALRPSLGYIQLKNNKVYASDTHVAVIIAKEEVFGNLEFAENEELYFEAEQWAKQKMYKASHITREGLYFTAKDYKGNTIGTMKVVTAEEFVELIGRFPDVECVFPADDKPKEPMILVSFNPVKLHALTTALGCDVNSYDLHLFGSTKAILVTTTETDDLLGTPKAIKGLIMPLFRD